MPRITRRVRQADALSRCHIALKILGSCSISLTLSGSVEYSPSEEMEPGVGVQVRDLLQDESIFLVDIEFSRTASPGLVLAGNIVSPAGLSMTTGAMLPVGSVLLDDLVDQLGQRIGATTVAQFRELPPEEQAELATLVIRACLASGAASRVTAKDVEVEPARQARNSRCPCGSGKKYRQCCGRA